MAEITNAINSYIAANPEMTAPATLLAILKIWFWYSKIEHE
jgi:hypothetical protein